ncbi:integrator complex subunit 15-like [Tubulanus polymorphus]|uniref:integrator complex subunit 15-like n=1 Tax=Tubulanus polymorphus TaxID=672921 RepID=UPI003DA35C86
MDDSAAKTIREMGFAPAMLIMLQRIEKCLMTEKVNIPGINASADDQAAQIAEDFIFHPYHRHPKRISAMNELQLQEILLTYFETAKDPVMARTVFRVIFGAKTAPHKMDLLFQLVSMAVGIKSSKLLDCAAAWMMYHNLHSTECIQLTERLIDDYCHLIPNAANTLRSLPSVSPSFTSHLITAFTSLYSFPPVESRPAFPPSLILDITAEWISSDCTLLLESCKTPQQQQQTPDSCVTTAIPGLIHWCIMSPLLPQQTIIDKADSKTSAEYVNNLYSKLHLGVLNSLLTAGKFANGPAAVVTIGDIAKLVDVVVSVLMTIPNVMTSEIVQNSLERLAQILQVTMVTGTIHTKLANLRKVCERLPHNPLLNMVLNSENLS